MRNIIIAALVLATAGFSKWSPDLAVQQVGFLTGCQADAGKSAIAILTSHGSSQFLIPSTSPIFANATMVATNAITFGKSVNILSKWLTTGSSADRAVFSYWVDGGCYDTQIFLSADAITLKK